VAAVASATPCRIRKTTDASAPKLRAAISAAAARRPAPQLIVVDLRSVDDIDDTGVAEQPTTRTRSAS
jgi:hypothetical protein